MWPFTKKKTTTTTQMMSPDQLSYSQVDITERFDDNERLTVDDWIATVPLNTFTPGGPAMNLPPVGASDDDVYRIASELSMLRESIPIPDDGVYCPTCHIANVELAKLRTPCPKCARPLLKFGWT